MGLEPCEAHWGGQNTTAPRREAQGQDRSAAREDQACAPDYPVILPGPRCRLYYRLLSKKQEMLEFGNCSPTPSWKVHIYQCDSCRWHFGCRAIKTQPIEFDCFPSKYRYVKFIVVKNHD